MDIEFFRTYCLSKAGVDEGFPFDEQTLVFKLMGKMFALTSLSRLPAQINLKCDPERAIELRDRYPEEILPGYHMSKKHWNTIILEGDLNRSLILEMIDHSYMLVKQKLSKSLIKELSKLEDG
jgi:predicted DNA-binding protein (MmcQ/YjbR family)